MAPRTLRWRVASLACLAVAISAHPTHATPSACAGNALVTLDGNAIVNVEWPERTADRLTGRAITNATLETTYQLALASDASVTDVTSTSRTLDDAKPTDHRSLAAGSVWWSDRTPSSLEQIVQRARALGGSHVAVSLAAASKDVPALATVDRIDDDNWTVTLGARHYDVQLDRGCLIAATLAAYGLTFERRDVAASAYPLADRYAAPPGAPYTATDITIPTPKGHVLAGTLTRPKAGGRVPAAVMITGISRHERNEGPPPFGPFRDIADVLGRAGIAVLRVDDRGVGHSTGDFDKATSFDEADDVRSELAWLRAQSGIDPTRIALVGHSEGGLIALVVASTDSKLSAIVLLAGSGVPGEQLNTWQTTETVEHDPAIPADRRAAELAKQLADRSDWSPRDIAFVATDPADYARHVAVPALVLQGGSDLHVPPRSAERLVATMRAAGNRDVSARIVPHLSHTLCPDVDGSIHAWTWLPSWRLSNELLETMTGWLATRLGTGRR
jgi:uncharacterized protein